MVMAFDRYRYTYRKEDRYPEVPVTQTDTQKHRHLLDTNRQTGARQREITCR